MNIPIPTSVSVGTTGADMSSLDAKVGIAVGACTILFATLIIGVAAGLIARKVNRNKLKKAEKRGAMQERQRLAEHYGVGKPIPSSGRSSRTSSTLYYGGDDSRSISSNRSSGAYSMIDDRDDARSISSRRSAVSSSGSHHSGIYSNIDDSKIPSSSKEQLYTNPRKLLRTPAPNVSNSKSNPPKKFGKPSASSGKGPKSYIKR